LAIFNHILRYPTIGFSPDRLANTTSPFLAWALITVTLRPFDPEMHQIIGADSVVCERSLSGVTHGNVE